MADALLAHAARDAPDVVIVLNQNPDFASAPGRRISRGVRNVEVNVVIDVRDAGGPYEARVGDRESIRVLTRPLWEEHLGAPLAWPPDAPARGWLSTWLEAARENVRLLSRGDARPSGAPARRMIGHLLPYSECASSRAQLEDLNIRLHPDELVPCYNPGWIEGHAAVHWIRTVF